MEEYDCEVDRLTNLLGFGITLLWEGKKGAVGLCVDGVWGKEPEAWLSSHEDVIVESRANQEEDGR